MARSHIANLHPVIHWPNNKEETMNFHPIPKNSFLVTKKCLKHPAQKTGLPIYKLIQFDTGLFSLMDTMGCLRSCDQSWAKKQKQPNNNHEQRGNNEK